MGEEPSIYYVVRYRGWGEGCSRFWPFDDLSFSQTPNKTFAQQQYLINRLSSSPGVAHRRGFWWGGSDESFSGGVSNTWWALSGCGACCPKICCWNIFLLLFVTGTPMFTFLSKSILVLALRGQNDKMRETHEAYQVPLLVGFHCTGYWYAIKTYCQEKYGIMLCYVLNPPTHLTHYELLPETFFTLHPANTRLKETKPLQRCN